MKDVGKQQARAGGLIEGSVGPFYVGINQPTFFLLTGIFAIVALVALVLLRDSAFTVRLVVGIGIALESGTLAHIYTEKIAGRPKLHAIGAHAAVIVLLAPLTLFALGVL